RSDSGMSSFFLLCDCCFSVSIHPLRYDAVPIQSSIILCSSLFLHLRMEGPQDSRKLVKQPEDFKFGRILGEGSYSTVVLAREQATGKEYAMKILEKMHIRKENKAHCVTRERDIMSSLDHPFIVKLYFTFQDVKRLYFGISYARNGELLKYIRKIGSFDETCTRFYSAEIVCALQYLHSKGIIHRDLKPENILLNEDMHIQITDFGTAKQLSSDDRANSFVGTAEYVSPELLTQKSACKSSDLWGLGCIIYQLVAGLPPFRAGSVIVRGFAEAHFDLANDLVYLLLQSKNTCLDPSNRLGCEEMGGYNPLRAHFFFKAVTWENLHLQTPPKLTSYLPAMAEDDEDYYGNYDDLLSQFSNMQVVHSRSFQPLFVANPSPIPNSNPAQRTNSNIEQYIHDLDNNSFELDLQFSIEVKRLLLEKQTSRNPWNQFVENNLILKMGPVDKRKGLFARRRQLLLTEGPHLYYVDPVNKVLKGEIPWSPALRPEAKNFKTFFVHTPNRTYYLMDPCGNADKWCNKIQEVWQKIYNKHFNSCM
uniref:3-phosphoinositide-dependent protein kinase 1 n=1 Tax=Salmo trutta TaxID=8032 RepID=A0A673XWF9_SALTR